MYTGNTAEEKHLHLVSFDIPVPVNYGGAIDIYYKLQALKAENVKIHLHCFQYGREPSSDLDRFCESVSYYPRRFNKAHLLHRIPYIVITRKSDELYSRLIDMPYPILFEGLHSCFYLDDKSLSDRIKVVRTHNIEHDYYLNLSLVEKNPFKRLYFKNEAVKLRRFEKVLKHATGIAAISVKDREYLSKKYMNVTRIAPFHPHKEISIREGTGDYALYHGSLEVGENNHAALFLIREVFSKIDNRLIIAGNKPSRELMEEVGKHPNVELITGFDNHGNFRKDIYTLISEAQINILPTFQATGVKLKLLAALYLGRHCIVNTPMVENTGLESLCHICDSPEEFIEKIKTRWEVPVDPDETHRRESILTQNGFSNSQNAKELISMLFH